MADIKIYNGSTWNNTAVRKYETKSEIITPPTTIYADGTAISTYTIKGNTVQNGTPTPSNPVVVNGVGDKTANLLCMKNGTHTYSAQGITVTITDNNTATFSGTATAAGGRYTRLSDTFTLQAGTYKYRKYGTSTATPYIQNSTSGTILYSPFTISEPTDVFFGVNVVEGTNYTGTTLQLMLTDSNYDGDYEPYGFKIPISSAQGTAYVYLNEPLYKIGDTADTINADGTVTRRIGKKVIDGTEILWTLYEVPATPQLYNYALYQFYTTNSLSLGGVPFSSCYSDIAPYGYTSQTRQQNDLGVYLVTSGDEIAFQMEAAKSSFPDVTAWTTYLSQNPVTVYYILATPTTEQITLPTIPTTDGANTITVDTTVQPSEFTATWTGWHDASVKEKSENLIPTNISDWEQGGISSTDGTDTVSTIRLRTIDFYPINNNTDYYISVNDTDYCYVNIILYDSSKQYAGQYYLVDSAINGATALAINVPSSAIANVAYYRAVAKKRDDSTITAQEITDIKPMLNLGSTAQTYEPYWK